MSVQYNVFRFCTYLTEEHEFSRKWGASFKSGQGRVFNTVMQKGHFGQKKCVYIGGVHKNVFININCFWVMN
jgi:hypothetical protein